MLQSVHEDMSTSEWHDDEGAVVKATFVGWGARVGQGGAAGALLAKLTSAVFGRVAAIEIHNVVRSIDRCEVCGCVVFLAGDGALYAARTDAEVGQVRSRLHSSGDDWEVLGHSELWVKIGDAACFVAPTLVIHLIADHGYAPPGEFVAAVLKT